MAAAQVQNMKINDAIELFATYVPQWNPNQNGAGEDKNDRMTVRANADSVSHTAANSVEDMLRLLAKHQLGERREHCMRMVRLEHTNDIPTQIRSARQILRSLARGF